MSGPAATFTYLAYRAGSALAMALPEAMTRPAATLTGQVLGLAMRERRRMLGRHLRRVHGPEVSERQLQRSVTAAFGSYGRYWLEVFRLPKETAATLEARCDSEGSEHLDAALEAGRGAIVATPHLGNWDMVAARFLTRGYRVTAVVEPLDPPELFEWFLRYRRSLGMEVVPLGDGAASALLRALQDNKTIALVCDRDLSRTGVEVEFFGERTTLPGGPAILALRSGAPILPTAGFFLPGGRQLTVIRPAVPVDRQGSLKEDVTRITQSLACELEALIRRDPEQWHLLQPNWPSDFATDQVARGS